MLPVRVPTCHVTTGNALMWELVHIFLAAVGVTAVPSLGTEESLPCVAEGYWPGHDLLLGRIIFGAQKHGTLLSLRNKRRQ